MKKGILLTYYFDMQKELDSYIAGKRGLILTERLSLMKRTFAAMVEFTECANDHQESFKDWKPNNQPKPTTLEEWIDGFHFVLSKGNNLAAAGLITDPNVMEFFPSELEFTEGTTKEEITMTYFVNSLALEIELFTSLQHNNHEYIQEDYYNLVCMYLGLAKNLGFNLEDIKVAYLNKNKENFARQNGESTKEGYEA